VVGATVGIVADDLTGAADTGAGFARRGHPTTVVWARPPFSPALIQNTNVLAVDAGTRVLGPVEAATRTREIVGALRYSGIGMLYKKADSLLRGHVGAELHAAVDAWHPGAVAVVAPAFPATGRTTVAGRQHVDGCPLEGPSVITMLADAGLRPEHASLVHVRGGLLRGLGERLAGLSSATLVCDAETDEDLRTIVRALASLGTRAVWAGSGGLAVILADIVEGPRGSFIPWRVVSGPILVIVGSCSAAARHQVAYARAAGISHVAVPIAGLDGSDDPAGAACTQAIAERLRRGLDVLVTVAGGIGAGGSNDPEVAHRLGRLVQPCAGMAAALVLTGGDTAASVLRAWGAEGIRLSGELAPGIAVGVTVGGGELGVITKAGAFGNESCLIDACAALRGGPVGAQEARG